MRRCPDRKGGTETANHTRNLQMYEALELRAEYDARIKTLKDCLPEAGQSSRARLRLRAVL